MEFEEFVNLVAPTLKDQKQQEEDLRDAFKVFDRNGERTLFFSLNIDSLQYS